MKIERDAYDVTRLVHVRREGDEHVIVEHAVEGCVLPPDTARRAADGDLEWTWARSPADDCPRCAAGACTQQVVLRGTTVLVLHDVADTLS